MRADFIDTLAELAQSDPRIVLLTADLGFTVVETFADRYPDRYFNVGVAETNMIALATGLASEGMVPFCYSIAAFLSMRCFEAFRDGPVLHGLPVRLIAVGGGVGYGVSGITHYAIEDIALMRSSGRVAVYAPSTSAVCAKVLQSTYSSPGPIYYRLSKDAVVDARLPVDELADVGYCRLGTGGLALVTYGAMASTALNVAESLHNSFGMTLQCIVVTHLDNEVVRLALSTLTTCSDIVTLEDHSASGGIGSMTAEVLAGEPAHPRLHRLGLGGDVWGGLGGSEGRLLARSGLGEDALCKRLRCIGSEGSTPCS